MEVRLNPKTETRLSQLASQSGRQAAEIVEDALAFYLMEADEIRERLNSRHDDIQSGRVHLMDGETFFEDLFRREREMLQKSDLK